MRPPSARMVYDSEDEHARLLPDQTHRSPRVLRRQRQAGGRLLRRRASGSTAPRIAGSKPAAATSASYVLEQGDIRFVLTSAARPGPSMRREFVRRHGDGVGVIALAGARRRGRVSTKRPARGAEPAIDAAGRASDENGVLRDRGDSCLRRHAHQVRRARRLRGTLRARVPSRASATVRVSRRRPRRPSTTSSATSSWARWRSGSGSLPRRWGSPSSCTSTTRRSRPSTRR